MSSSWRVKFCLIVFALGTVLGLIGTVQDFNLTGFSLNLESPFARAGLSSMPSSLTLLAGLFMRGNLRRTGFIVGAFGAAFGCASIVYQSTILLYTEAGYAMYGAVFLSCCFGFLEFMKPPLARGQTAVVLTVPAAVLGLTIMFSKAVMARNARVRLPALVKLAMTEGNHEFARIHLGDPYRYVNALMHISGAKQTYERTGDLDLGTCQTYAFCPHDGLPTHSISLEFNKADRLLYARESWSEPNGDAVALFPQENGKNRSQYYIAGGGYVYADGSSAPPIDDYGGD